MRRGCRARRSRISGRGASSGGAEGRASATKPMRQPSRKPLLPKRAPRSLSSARPPSTSRQRRLS
eukprot:4649596-Pyramimonas_sp.AAC.1